MSTALSRRASAVLATTLCVLSAASTALATRPASVRVALHHRGADTAGSTYVDITVQGTRTPIRLVRRVNGPCVRVDPPAGGGVLARVECDADGARVAFEVARDADEVVVRRGPAPPAPTATSSTSAASAESAAQPATPAAPTQPTQPTAATAPTQPTAATAPTQPTAPTRPTRPTRPSTDPRAPGSDAATPSEAAPASENGFMVLARSPLPPDTDIRAQP